MTTTTIQEIFEMRKNGQFEQAYESILPMYREHHGHYTTLCMFWTATDVMRLRIEAGKCDEAEQIMASLRSMYPVLQDKDQVAAHTLTRLALLLATKEQELRKLRSFQSVTADNSDCVAASENVLLSFSLLDYMSDFGISYLCDEDWQMGEFNGRPVPSFGMKIISRIFHEVCMAEDSDADRLEAALEYVKMGLEHTPRNKHLLRYQANLLFRLGDKKQSVAIYRQLIEHCRDSYLFSELADMVEDRNEQAALLSKAIVNQRLEVFAQKDRLKLADLLKEYFPQNAAYELQQVMQLRDSLGQRPNRQMVGLQNELADVAPVSAQDQQEFYQRLMKVQRVCA